MKRWIIRCLSILAGLLLFAACAAGCDFSLKCKLAYFVNDDGKSCTIIGLGNFTGTELVIPSEIDGYAVTDIDSHAFQDCDDLVSVTLPKGVTSIENSTFRNCDNLKSVTIPDSVKTIRACAFWDCTSLTSVEIPDSVESLGNYAFSGCSNLTSVKMGNSVKSIGN